MGEGEEGRGGKKDRKKESMKGRECKSKSLFEGQKQMWNDLLSQKDLASRQKVGFIFDEERWDFFLKQCELHFLCKCHWRRMSLVFLSFIMPLWGDYSTFWKPNKLNSHKKIITLKKQQDRREYIYVHKYLKALNKYLVIKLWNRPGKQLSIFIYMHITGNYKNREAKSETESVA